MLKNCTHTAVILNPKELTGGNGFAASSFKKTSRCSFSKLTVQPISVAARSKARVYGHSLAGIVGSNPAGGHGCLC